MDKGKDLNKRDRIILMVCIIAILLIGGVWGGIKYKKYLALKQAYPILKSVSLHVTNALSFETEKTNITFDELFKKLESSISEIDKKIFEIQNLESSGQKDKFELMLGYLKASQELLRTQLNRNRKLLDLSMSNDEAQNAEQELSEATYYSLDRLTGKRNAAIQEQEKAAIEYRKANNEFVGALAEFINLTTKMSSFIPQEFLIKEEVKNKLVVLSIESEAAKASEPPASAPAAPTPDTTTSIANVITPGNQEANRYRKDASGVVLDTQTNLEWYVGPDKDTDWEGAKSWVANLSVAGGGWRMPGKEELRGLYQEGKGSRNMTPLLETTGWWVWASENQGSSDAWGVGFSHGVVNWGSRSTSDSFRGFAVRSHQ